MRWLLIGMEGWLLTSLRDEERERREKIRMKMKKVLKQFHHLLLNIYLGK